MLTGYRIVTNPTEWSLLEQTGVVLPDDLTTCAKSFMSNILCKREDRWELEKIREHPFVTGEDFDEVHIANPKCEKMIPQFKKYVERNLKEIEEILALAAKYESENSFVIAYYMLLFINRSFSVLHKMCKKFRECDSSLVIVAHEQRLKKRKDEIFARILLLKTGITTTLGVEASKVYLEQQGIQTNI